MLTYFTGIIAPTRSGHYCYLNGRRYESGQPSAFTPWSSQEWALPLVELGSIVRSGIAGRGDPQPEGVLYVETVAGWSLVACWDRSAPDNRGGSSATWAVQTDNLDTARAAIREHYAPTLDRIERHVGKPIWSWPRLALLSAYPQAPGTAVRCARCPTCGGSGVV